jgi:hypothetical protein
MAGRPPGAAAHPSLAHSAVARPRPLCRKSSPRPERGRGKRYPSELRERIIRYMESRVGDGMTLEKIGEEIAISWRTLSRWRSEWRGGFKQVEVVAVPAKSLTVHGPRGIRIEGLDLDETAELIRRLS